MRWEDGRRSDNVEDRRAAGGGSGRRGGLIGGGIGTMLLALVAMYFGIDPSVVLNQASAPVSAPSSQQRAAPGADDRLAEFTKVVLADTEDVWRQVFAQEGKQYQDPVLVMFSGVTRSGCGSAQSASGPFYCPADNKIYIDLDFYRTLKTRLGAAGDFAQAYVVAHEVGHHVQQLLGVAPRVHQAMQRASETEANALSVRLELQADCLAGVWANRAHKQRQILENGDIEEAMNAAAAIGDDKLQADARGYVRPESFTHGSSAQRVRWFRMGLESGQVASCNTFARNARL